MKNLQVASFESINDGSEIHIATAKIRNVIEIQAVAIHGHPQFEVMVDDEMVFKNHDRNGCFMALVGDDDNPHFTTEAGGCVTVKVLGQGVKGLIVYTIEDVPAVVDAAVATAAATGGTQEAALPPPKAN